MKLSEALLNPTEKDLRTFGLTCAAIVSVVFGLIFPLLFIDGVPLWPWMVAAILALWALIHPSSLIFVYRPWLRIGAIIGWIQTRIILGLIFYVMVTPFGLVRRFFDGTIKELDAEEKSYRIKSNSTDDKQMENPY